MGAGINSDRPPEELVPTAKEACLRLLTIRPRTRAELRDALLRKRYPDDVVEQVLGRLDQAGLIDDAEFAEMWVRSRHLNSGMSRRAVVTELRRKGVDEETASAAAAEVDDVAEERRARHLVRKKLRPGVAGDVRAARRLVAMLARKGYPQGLACRVVKEELGAVGGDLARLDELLA